jgi:hypothetical protein
MDHRAFTVIAYRALIILPALSTLGRELSGGGRSSDGYKSFTKLVHQRQKIWYRDFAPIMAAHMAALFGISPNPSGESHGC